MASLNEIIEFIEEEIGAVPKSPETDIWEELGCVANDLDDFLIAYAKEYRVDMSGYLWYFHNTEEGQNFGGLFFKPPYARVERIPITPKMLAEFSIEEKWDMNYPPHEIPKKRKDLLINRIIILSFVGGIMLIELLRFI